MKTKCLLILLILFLVSPFYCWEVNQKGKGKTNFEVITSIFGENVYHLGARFTYRASVKTEVGWGMNFYKLNDAEQYLKGKYLTFGPVWRYNTRFLKKFGLQFTLNLFGSIYSSITSTPAETDKTNFKVEINPELLFYKRIKFKKKLNIFPAAGVCTMISYYEMKEEKKEGEEDVSGYTRGIVETRVVFKLPIIFPVSKKSFIIIQPAYKLHLFSSKLEKMETFTIKIGIHW